MAAQSVSGLLAELLSTQRSARAEAQEGFDTLRRELQRLSSSLPSSRPTPTPTLATSLSPAAAAAAAAAPADAALAADLATVAGNAAVETEASQRRDSAASEWTSEGLSRSNSRVRHLPVTFGEWDLSQADNAPHLGVEAIVEEAAEEPVKKPGAALLLPEGWPAGLSTPHAWAFSDNGNVDRGRRASTVEEKRGTTLSALVERTASNGSTSSTGTIRLDRVWRCVVIDPNSNFYMVHCVIGLIVLLIDATMTPFVLAWDVPMDDVLVGFAMFITCYWTADLILNFCTGYYRQGELETNPLMIARHYLHTWLAMDMSLVVLDWAGTVLQRTAAADGSFQLLRTAKLGRLLRVMAVIRLVKCVKVITEFLDSMLTEGRRFAISVISFLCGTVWLVHLFSCAWHAVGRFAPSDTGTHWTDIIVGDVPFLEQGEVYQYTTAFHFAATQLTLGAIDINARNSLERIFNIFCLLFGLVFSSTLVSSLSASMVDMHIAAQDRVQKLRALRQFLREKAVDRKTVRIVQEKIFERLDTKERLHYDDVAALSLLSASFQANLRLEIFRPQLHRHPLFRLWEDLGSATDATLLRRVCSGAMDEQHVRPQDDLFTPGHAKAQAYCLCSGQLSYIQEPDASPVEVTTETMVSAGRWFCEAALWVDWLHVGTARAADFCEVMFLRVSAVSEIFKMPTRHIIRDMTRQYAQQFYSVLLESRPPHAPWPSDLSVPCTDFADMLIFMGVPIQTAIGLNAIDQVVARSWRRFGKPHAFEKLQREVEVGKSLVMLDHEGDIQRIVALAAVKLQREDGHIFVQIGKREDGRVSPACQLPGMKQARAESALETVQRVLNKKLKDFNFQATPASIERSVQSMQSKEYSVCTRYMKSVCIMQTTNFETDTEQLFDLACTNSDPEISHLPSSVSMREVSELVDVQVFYVGSVEVGVYYAWLPPPMFERLSEQKGEAALVSWLQRVELPDAMAGSKSV